MRELIEHGGLVPYVKARLKSGSYQAIGTAPGRENPEYATIKPCNQ